MIRAQTCARSRSDVPDKSTPLGYQYNTHNFFSSQLSVIKVPVYNIPITMYLLVYICTHYNIVLYAAHSSLSKCTICRNLLIF